MVADEGVVSLEGFGGEVILVRKKSYIVAAAFFFLLAYYWVTSISKYPLYFSEWPGVTLGRAVWYVL